VTADLLVEALAIQLAGGSRAEWDALESDASRQVFLTWAKKILPNLPLPRVVSVEEIREAFHDSGGHYFGPNGFEAIHALQLPKPQDTVDPAVLADKIDDILYDYLSTVDQRNAMRRIYELFNLPQPPKGGV